MCKLKLIWVLVFGLGWSLFAQETLNLKFLNQNVLTSGSNREDDLLAFFEETGAEILALTEAWEVTTNDQWAEDLGYNVIYTGDETKEQEDWLTIGGYFMPATLITKYPIVHKQYYHYSRAALIALLEVTPDDTLAVCVLHLFDSHDKKMEDLGELLGFLDEYKDKYPIIVTGDFNSPSPLDGEGGQDVGRLQLAYDWGLQDSYREIYPDHQENPGGTIGGGSRRIDYILNTPDLTPTMCEVTTDDYIQGGSDVSDHLGVYCEIEMPLAQTTGVIDVQENQLQVTQGQGKISIQLQSNEPAQFTLTDVSGRAVKQFDSNQSGFVEVSLGEFQPGLLILKARVGNSLITKSVAVF